MKADWAEVRIKVASMIAEYGVELNYTNIIAARGYWTHRHQDVQAWHAFGKAKTGNKLGVLAGFPVAFGSWDNLGECARYGIVLKHDDLVHIVGQFDVYANHNLEQGA